MKSLKIVACMTGLLVASLPASAAFDFGAASDYNAFVFGNYDAYVSSTQGRLAVGGNLTAQNYTIIDQSSPFYNQIDNDYVGTALVVGGNLNVKNFKVNYGDVYVGGSADIQNLSTGKSYFAGDLSINKKATLVGGTVAGTLTMGGVQNVYKEFNAPNRQTGITELPVDFATTQSYLSDYSKNGLATLGSTGTVSKSNSVLTLTGGTAIDDMQVFNLKATDLTYLKDIALTNVGTATSVLININAQTVNWNGLGGRSADSIFKDLSDKGYDVLFNFYNTTSLNLEGMKLFGNVLATSAAVSANNGWLNGLLVANTFNSECNCFTINAMSMPPAVPEPGEYARMVMGLAMVGFLVRMRRKA